MTNEHIPLLGTRIGITPLVDLADCTHVTHRAVGSPHFHTSGEPTGFDPLITLLIGELGESRLPRSTAIVIPSDARPLLSIDPLLRTMIQRAQPESCLELQMGLEGRLESGEVKRLSPGALSQQTSALLLAHLTSPESEDVRRFSQAVAHAISTLAPGSTVRIPVLFPDDEALSISSLEILIDELIPSLLQGWPKSPPRRLILISPDSENAQRTFSLLMKRALHLSLVDRYTPVKLMPRLSYGLAEQPEYQLVDPSGFTQAIHEMERALKLLFKGSRNM